MEDNSNGLEKVTNLEYLSELSRGDPRFISDMVRIFLDENPKEISMLEKGITEKNLYLINLAAHKLRSTLPFVGIEKFIQKEIEEIEHIAHTCSAFQKIEIATDEDNGKTIEVITTDRSVIQKIENLFPKVKTICEKARKELS